MRKIGIILFITVLIMGCSKAAPPLQDDYSFQFNQQTMVVGEDVKTILSQLGNPKDQYSSPSCVFEGEDTVYDYGNFQLTTYLTQGKEVLTGIYFNDDTIATKEGVRIGFTKQAMIDTYGNDYQEEYGAYTYNKGLTDLSFVIVNDIIISIAYLHIVD